MKKIVMSMFSVLMLCALLVIPAKAGGTVTSAGISVEGTKYPLDEKANGTGWSYDGKGTLTLNGYHGGSIAYYADDSKYSRQVLKIELKGDNTATSVWLGHTYFDMYRIRFTGTGTLVCQNEDGFPLYMDVYGGTVTVSQANSRFDILTAGGVLNLNRSCNGTDIVALDSKLIVGGGTVNVHTDKQYFIWYPGTEEDITIANGGTLNVTADDVQSYRGVLEVRTDSSLMTKYKVTDFSGQPAKLDREYRKDFVEWGYIIPVSGPAVPLSQVRIVGNEKLALPQDEEPETPDEAAETPVPSKGTLLAAGKVTYKVTKSDAANGTVSYERTTSTGTSITVPASVKIDGVTYKVTSVASNAFKGNKKITKVTVGSNVTSIGSGAFSGCTKLKTVKGCSKVTSIGDKAFYGCAKLAQVGSAGSTVTLSKVKTIGTSAFYGCKALKKVNLTSAALTKIGASAFRGCTALTSFTAKSTKLSSIGKNAFYGDKKLATVTLKTEKLTKTKVGANAFKGIKSTCKFKVPSSKVKTYKTIFKTKGAGSKIKVTK